MTGWVGVAPPQNSDRVLQGREPARFVGAHRVHVPRVRVPGAYRQGTSRTVPEFLPGSLKGGPETDEHASSFLAPTPVGDGDGW